MRFLHLSDIHFDNDLESYFKEFVLNGFLNDITENYCEKKIDFIVITGDLINQGGKNFDNDINYALEQFNINFIDEITEYLEINQNNIYICAGNHDLEFTLDSRITELGLQKALIDPKDVKELIFDSNTDEGIKRVAPINEYQKNLNKSCVSKGKLHFNYNYVFNGKKILISSFNNVWRCYGDDKRYLWLGEQQIVDSIKYCKESDFSIAIMHYPLSDLNPIESDRIENLLLMSYDIILTGHTHAANTIRKDNLNSEIIESNCASNWSYNTFGEKNEFRNGYSIIDVDFEEFDITFNHRIYSEKKLKYITNLELGKDGISKFKLQAKDKSREIEEKLEQSSGSYTIINDPQQMSFDIISGSVLRSKINKDFYWKRSFDTKITESINENQSIIIVGNSLAGKSRSLYESLKQVTDKTIIIPDTSNEKWIDKLPKTEKSILLVFDDVQLMISRFGISSVEKVIKDVLLKEGMIAMTCRSGIEYFHFFNQLSAAIRESIKNIHIDKMDNCSENDFLTFLKNNYPQKLDKVDYTAFDHNIGSYFLELTIMKERYIKLETIINEYNQGINIDLPRIILQAIKLFYNTHNFSGNKSFDIKKIKDYCERRCYGKRIGYYDETSINWKNNIGSLLLEKQKNTGLIINNIEWERALNILSSNEFELNFITKTISSIQIEEAYLEKIITLPFSDSEIITHIYDLYNKQDIRRLGFITTQESFENMIQKSNNINEALLFLKKQDLLGIEISVNTYLYILELEGVLDTKLQIIQYAKKSQVPLKPILLKILNNDISNTNQLIMYLLKVKDYGLNKYVQERIKYNFYCKDFIAFKDMLIKFYEFGIEIDNNFLKCFSKTINKDNINSFFDLLKSYNIKISPNITNTLIINHKKLGYNNIKELFMSSNNLQINENTARLLFYKYKLAIDDFVQLLSVKKIILLNEKKFMIEYAKCNIKLNDLLSLAIKLNMNLSEIDVICINTLLKKSSQSEMQEIIDFINVNNIIPNKITSENLSKGIPKVMGLNDFINFLQEYKLALTETILERIMHTSDTKSILNISDLLSKYFIDQHDLIYEQLFKHRFQNDVKHFIKLIKLKNVEVQEKIAYVLLETNEWDIVSLIELFQKDKINYNRKIIFKYIYYSNSLLDTFLLVNKNKDYDKDKPNTIALLVQLSTKKMPELYNLVDAKLELLCDIYNFEFLYCIIKKNKKIRNKIILNIKNIKHEYHPRVAEAIQLVGDNVTSKVIIENLDFKNSTTYRVLGNIYSKNKRKTNIAIENYRNAISCCVCDIEKLKTIIPFSMFILNKDVKDEEIWLINIIKDNYKILKYNDDEFNSLRSSTISLFIRLIIKTYGIENSISQLIELNKIIQLPSNQLKKYFSRISTINKSEIDFYSDLIIEMSNSK